jgi:hypothetical protein
MITCSKHGNQTEFVVGNKNYCPVCVQEIFDKRISNYEVNE